MLKESLIYPIFLWSGFYSCGSFVYWGSSLGWALKGGSFVVCLFLLAFWHCLYTSSAPGLPSPAPPFWCFQTISFLPIEKGKKKNWITDNIGFQNRKGSSSTEGGKWPELAMLSNIMAIISKLLWWTWWQAKEVVHRRFQFNHFIQQFETEASHDSNQFEHTNTANGSPFALLEDFYK